jgi:hypothetical protein
MIALPEAPSRPADVVRRGARVIVSAWLIPPGGCVTMPHIQIHGGTCDGCQERARAITAFREGPTPAEPREAERWEAAREAHTIVETNARRVGATPPYKQASVQFHVTSAEDGRFVWASSRLGDDVGAAVALAFRVAGGANYFTDVAIGNKEARGEELEAVEGWQLRRCRRCAARTIIPSDAEVCPTCSTE